MGARVLIYMLRRDLRLSDNPIFNEIAKLNSQSQKPFTHLLPLYVFPAQQIEVSGFLKDDQRSPYPEARSHVGNFWRCGHHRAKFTAESVFDLKKSLEGIGSGLEIRVGMLQDVVKQVLDGFQQNGDEVHGLWMTEEIGVEEKREERAIRKEVESRGKEFKVYIDEKYFVDDRDIPFKHPREVPDVFTSYRKMVEPLRDAPRKTLPAPSSLPPLPASTPAQADPFSIPSDLEGVIEALHKPLEPSLGLQNPPRMPKEGGVRTSVPFSGGESTGLARIEQLITSGAATAYKHTRNNLIGVNSSTKLSAWLAHGCITARQVHFSLFDFEEGRTDVGKDARGYGEGENEGTGHLRFELLWRDYMRLVAWKFGPRLFRIEGLKGRDDGYRWSSDATTLERVLEGSTGCGLVDASARELFVTGYTSNRARQNFASTLAKRLHLDWRLGAAWYECLLIDHDVASNWGNWAYVAGVGNDPRGGGDGRVFNPVKQAADYDRQANYVHSWVEETRELEPDEARQYWKVDNQRKAQLGLRGNIGAEKPLFRIDHPGGRGGGKGDGGGGKRGGRRKGHGGGRSGFSKAEAF